MARQLSFAVVLALSPAIGLAADKRIEVVDAGSGVVEVTCDGNAFTSYVYRGTPKPVLFPLVGPGGVRMTRDYPLVEGTLGEATDHPHHQSLWFGHGSVNGIDFWAIGEGTGEIRHGSIEKVSSGPVGVIDSTSAWVAPDGEEVCRERRSMQFRASENLRTIDLTIVLSAGSDTVVFGDTKEGTMATRTRPELRLTASSRGANALPTGHAVNSEGDKDQGVWGKRAKWVDYWGEVDGERVGMAIFDHPQNLRHPTTWHARDYGLVAANPFGLHDFLNEPSGSGDYRLNAGESLELRYRFVLHSDDAKSAGIPSRYEEWAHIKEAPWPR
ncbi:hypothetical protein Pla123a_43570 [Posidoniimonas polymericola]|uniref:Methane oxygenase PmoA n=1 Tax=Posidoniimonas polymericola TaxID=2528002 RepID=A0A5C5XW52_9BACT|nr:PmoA family protein [Posidoniimonas polymericola]TWT66928.1 hypothetical protein Pla123a_43570 [Posidoniimonas polymericola]